MRVCVLCTTLSATPCVRSCAFTACGSVCGAAWRGVVQCRVASYDIAWRTRMPLYFYACLFSCMHAVLARCALCGIAWRGMACTIRNNAAPHNAQPCSAMPSHAVCVVYSKIWVALTGVSGVAEDTASVTSRGNGAIGQSLLGSHDYLVCSDAHIYAHGYVCTCVCTYSCTCGHAHVYTHNRWWLRSYV